MQPMAVSKNKIINNASRTVRDALQPVRQSKSANSIETRPVNNTAEENQTLFNDGASSPDENTSARHGKVAIFGVFDGSARLMRLTDWAGKMAATDPNELWCFPGSANGR